MQFVQGGRSGHAAVNNPGHAQFVVSGPLAATEQADTAAAAGTVGSSGTLAATDAADIVALTGATASVGTIGAIEASDAGAFAGSVTCSGPLSAIEAADSFTGTAVVADAGSAFGMLAASEVADTAELAGAVSGEVIEPPILIVGGRYSRPQWPIVVEGVGYGVLPQLEGEAFGLVVGVGSGAGNLPRSTGAGAAAVGVDGRSAARLVIRAAASGDLGFAGSASGSIVGIKAAAIGQHHDDEIAIVALLLAA